MPLDVLWKAAKAGDKYAAFYTELAATSEDGGDFRRGIGLSRLCEVCLAAIEELEADGDLVKCLKPRVVSKARAEMGELQRPT